MRLHVWREHPWGYSIFDVPFGIISEKSLMGILCFGDPSSIGTSLYVSYHMIARGSDYCDSCKEKVGVFVVDSHCLFNSKSLMK